MTGYVLLSCNLMFNEDFHAMLRLELTNEARIPTELQLNGNYVRHCNTHHSSLATPKSLQHLISALLLQASVAVAMPFTSKYSCSPRATATRLSDTQY